MIWPVPIRVAGITRYLRRMEDLASDRIVLMREADNRQDTNAIAVFSLRDNDWTDRQKVGYIPKEISANLKTQQFPVWGTVVWKSNRQLPGIRIQV